ncbi:hypothetical protein PV387_42120 [Streptomyces sp. ME02-6987-2C]|nr:MULTISPECIES: hypothetical protein [unclassified Streptomyces]MDX3372481.1 hypothetical protein [Streptomyces sp. ME02-6987-2C]MDX3427271.1 hypothetical protein [Streptomyces sp. ME02-6985-2c]
MANAGEPGHGGRGDEHADGDRDLGAKSRVKLGGGNPARYDQSGDHRQECQPSHQGRVMQGALDVVVEEQEGSEQADPADEDGEVGATAVPVHDDAQGQQRICGALLLPGKGREHDSAGGY